MYTVHTVVCQVAPVRLKQSLTENIKPIALVVIKFPLSEGISKSVGRSISQSVLKKISSTTLNLANAAKIP